jgi:hypothetical protein
MNYTEDQLKAALVRALPEKLRTNHEGAHCWIGKLQLVDDEHWPAIVGMVIQQLKTNGAVSGKYEELYQSQMTHYTVTLWCIVYNKEVEFFNWPVIHHAALLTPLLLATWQQEASALVEIGAIKIEP